MEAFLRDSLKGLRDLFWPRRCCVCERGLDIDEEDICPECFSDIPLTYFWDWDENPAFEKLREKASVKAAACLFFFHHGAPYNHIMHSIKYGGGRLLGYRLGFILGRHLAGSGRFGSIDAVTSVPLHPLRRFKRGYNQAEVIARGIAAAMGLPYTGNLLVRRRYTRSQARLATEEKARNVSGAFRLRENEAKKMAGLGTCHILLVDDTLTTGATLGECACALCEKFAVSVAALAYAG